MAKHEPLRLNPKLLSIAEMLDIPVEDIDLQEMTELSHKGIVAPIGGCPCDKCARIRKRNNKLQEESRARKRAKGP